jgi:hypothetical protein
MRFIYERELCLEKNPLFISGRKLDGCHLL